MIDYSRVKEQVDKYNQGLLNKVRSTTQLDPIQSFFMQKLSNQSIYRNKSDIEIYKADYDRIDKITGEHVQRGVDDIEKVFQNMGLGDDYVSLAKVAHELHDIARRPQYIETGTTVDGDSYDRDVLKMRNLKRSLPAEIVNHATHGSYLLKNGLFDFLDVPVPYREIIYNSVKYHSNNKLPINLDVMVPDSLFDGRSLDTVIYEPAYYTNLIRLYTQTVKSVDNFDLNNKVLLGAIPIVRERFGLDVLEGDKLEDFAKRWGVSEKCLRDYNALASNSSLKPGQIIFIPTNEVPREKLVIPSEYMEMLKNDTFPDKIKTLQLRKDYTFLTAQVWRLSLLRNINFKSLLQIVEDEKMLDRMLNLYPNDLKEIMKEAFQYADENIVKPGLENNDSKIYTLRRK